MYCQAKHAKYKDKLGFFELCYSRNEFTLSVQLLSLYMLKTHLKKPKHNKHTKKLNKNNNKIKNQKDENNADTDN